MSQLQTPAQAPSKDDIEQLCTLAQTAFYALLGVLAFFAAVILSTTDSDFLIGSKQTEIPLIKISAPTERFFFLAPIVTTALYCHLHLYCIKLWSAAREAQMTVIRSVGSKSLVADLVFYLCPDHAVRPRGGGHWADLGTIVAGLLIWVAHPVVLVWALARSQAASRIDLAPSDQYSHVSLLLPSTVHGMTILCLAVTTAVGIASLLAALSVRWPRLVTRPLGMIAVAAAFLVPLAAGDGLARAQLRAVQIDRQNLVGIDGEWPRASERRAQFRKDWCKERGVDRDVCGNIPAASRERAKDIADRRTVYCTRERLNPARCDAFFAKLDADFHADWREQRTAELERLPELNLNSRDLDGASAQGAKFINARMEQAALSGAMLKDADFEGADLLGARLDGAIAFYATFDRANLTRADLRAADLTSAAFEDAALRDADLRGASLVNANLLSADLRGADLRAANLTDARLGRADLTDANLEGAVFANADLTGVVGLTQPQLDAAVGDLRTRLPVPPDGRRLSLTTCWRALPEDVSPTLDALPDGKGKVDAAKAVDRHRCGRTERPDTVLGPPRPERPAVAPNYARIRRAYETDRDAERGQVQRPPPAPDPAADRLSALVADPPLPRPRPRIATLSTRDLPTR